MKRYTINRSIHVHNVVESMLIETVLDVTPFFSYQLNYFISLLKVQATA